jgi:hypothetical protein
MSKEERYMDVDGTALLPHSQDEVLVAALRSWLDKGEGSSQPLVTELWLLRSHHWELELKRLPVMYEEGKREEVSCWSTDGVIPLGDRFVLWVDYLRDIIVYSDMWLETPQLRYLSLPVEPRMCTSHNDRNDASSYRSINPTDSGRTVRFVEVSPRCCCCPGTTVCVVSRHAFTINTWVNDVTAHNFQTRKGLRQGDPLSRILFNIIADMLAILIARSKDEGKVGSLLHT